MANICKITSIYFANMKDLAGGDRQRVFWRHHYAGTQGVIFFIDVSDSEERIKEAVKVKYYILWDDLIM